MEATSNPFVNQVSSYTTSSFAPAANSIRGQSEKILTARTSYHLGHSAPGDEWLSYLSMYKRVCFGKACNLIDE